MIEQAKNWRLKTQALHLGGSPKIMGIVNVTPDSFSDGGKFLQTEKAVEHALKLVEDGADVLDIGGESTRPYSESVTQQDELDRVLPVIESLVKKTDKPISIDTSKAVVAREAVRAGAEIINDVTGLEGDSEMILVAKSTGAGICAMHMQGTPQIMQDNPTYQNVTEEVFEYLKQKRDSLVEQGIESEKLCLDPGIGFGKTHEHNFTLIRECEKFLELGHPILVGHSRKGFIAKAIGDKLADRDVGTLATSLVLAQKGVHVLRVHNVEATFQGLNILQKVS